MKLSFKMNWKPVVLFFQPNSFWGNTSAHFSHLCCSERTVLYYNLNYAKCQHLLLPWKQAVLYLIIPSSSSAPLSHSWCNTSCLILKSSRPLPGLYFPDQLALFDAHSFWNIHCRNDIPLYLCGYYADEGSLRCNRSVSVRGESSKASFYFINPLPNTTSCVCSSEQHRVGEACSL